MNTGSSAINTLSFIPHDHDRCVHDQLAQAEARCAQKGVQLTAVRRRVLELLLQQHQALGAYDLLDVIKREGLGSQPPAVYRALDFLVAQGLAHKVERLNAFVACCVDQAPHRPAFLVCSSCSKIAELPIAEILGDVSTRADALGFEVIHCTIEIEGRCSECQSDG